MIIKRKRVFASESHHGGAWKVAYADFVTSMMAFFMLLWILGATTEEQRRGLADFFDPTIPVSQVSGGGVDVLHGDSIYSTNALSSDGHGGIAEYAATDAALAERLAALLEEATEGDAVRLTLSPEGVVIDLMDTADQPVFPLGKAELTDRLRRIMATVAPALTASGRMIKITGHTDDLPFVRDDYSNWELSSDRAHAARRLAQAQGVPEAAFFEVSGQADRLPIDQDPSAPGNRRISIVLLNPETLPLSAR